MIPVWPAETMWNMSHENWGAYSCARDLVRDGPSTTQYCSALFTHACLIRRSGPWDRGIVFW